MRRHQLLRLPAAFFAALALALVLAQSLGVLHRVVHAQVHDGGGGLHALFAGDHEDGGCDLYDQLTHGDALCGQAPSAQLPAAPAAAVRRHAAWHLASQAAGFLARGPPALS